MNSLLKALLLTTQKTAISQLNKSANNILLANRRNKNNEKLKRRLINFMSVLLFLFSSCNNSGIIVIDANDYLVKDTTKWNLENTKWHLVAFVDLEAQTMREPLNVKNINDPDRYTLNFSDQSDSTDTTTISGIFGRADLNDFWGCYNVNYNNSTIRFYKIFKTGADPLFENDEDNYFSVIWDIVEFKIYKNYLQLFYNDKKKYLLFERRQ